MSYFRRGMGDGPITDPSQLDNGTVVATVDPTRVGCSQIAADSPFRAPGQPCGPGGAGANGGQGPLDWLLGLIRTDVAAAAPSAASTGMTDDTKLILGGAAVLAIYYLTRRKR